MKNIIPVILVIVYMILTAMFIVVSIICVDMARHSHDDMQQYLLTFRGIIFSTIGAMLVLNLSTITKWLIR